MGVKAVDSIPNWSRLANYPPNACRQLRMELTLICAYKYIHDEEYLKKIGWHDYKRKLLSELRVAEGYENLLSFNHSLIKGISIIPRNESSKILFTNFLIFTRGKFINRINLSKKIQYLSRKSLFSHEMSTFFSLFSFLPSLPPRYFTSSRRSTGFYTPSPNEFHPIPVTIILSRSREKEGEGNNKRVLFRGGVTRRGRGRRGYKLRRWSNGGCREALREGKGSFNESTTSKCHATPLFVT